MEGAGELVITRGPLVCRCGHGWCAEWLRIDAAPPRIVISDELLHGMLVFGCGPHADLRPGPGAAHPGKPDGTSPAELSAWFNRTAGNLEGWVLTVRGVNRTVIYRITGKVPDMYAWYAEWPD